MGVLDRTIVGMDGSKGSSAAFKWTVAQAGESDPPGEIHAVHAFSPGIEVFSPAAISIYESARDENQRKLREEWINLPASHPVTVTELVVDDEPAAALMNASRSNGNAPIVVGHQGHSRWSKHHIGHVAGQLIHRSDSPLILTNESTEPAPVSGTVVIGVHGVTELSNRPLAWAIEFAEERHLPLRLVRVAAPPVTGPGYGFPGMTYDNYLASIEEESRRATADLAAAVSTAHDKIDVTWDVGIGHPTHVLAKKIEAIGAGLVVIGGHHSGSIASFLTDGVSRHLPPLVDCPVAIICAE